jgi:transcriptional regulator of arginine metabolism
MKKDERTKPRRQEKIREIVENNIVETQEELTALLRQEHIAVTQATVSRDIKELMLVKVPTGDGRSRYAFPKSEGGVRRENRLEALFEDAVTGVDASGNLVVLRTLPGMANAVASALDTAQWKNIIGTVAGDDTILVVVKPESAAFDVAARMKVLSGVAGGDAAC